MATINIVWLTIHGLSVVLFTSFILCPGPRHVSFETTVPSNQSASLIPTAGSVRSGESVHFIVPEDHASSDTEDQHSNKTNPYEGNSEAIKEGSKLYEKMNCYGCHGRDGGGGMGPTLREPSHWQYGTSDAAVFETIREGRPRMPGFKKHLTATETWKLIAYVRTFARDHES